MLFKKEGFPEEGELVICTVTNVQSNSVFVRMDEYGRSGMIHISEISPGRIRNIRDFVKEGKIIVCKVLRINLERGHVDLSLRRVSDNQRKIKVNQVKQEQKAEKILEVVAKMLKKDVRDVYAAVTGPVFQRYDQLFSCFMDVVSGDVKLASLGVDAAVAKVLTDVIVQRLKPQEVEVRGTLRMQTYAPDGVLTIRKLLKRAVERGADVHYLSAGTYRLSVRTKDYKSAEKLLDGIAKDAVAQALQSGGAAEFARAA